MHPQMNHLLGDLSDIWFPIRLPNAYYLATPSDRFLLALGGSCTSTSGRYGNADHRPRAEISGRSER